VDLIGHAVFSIFFRMCVAFVMMRVHHCDWDTAKAKADDWIMHGTEPRTPAMKRLMYGGGLVLLIAILAAEAMYYFSR